MNFLNLEYFLVVAEELNITRAAQRLYISQQSLSNHIRRLEKDLNTKLFERSPNMALTYSGQKLAKAAGQMLAIKRQVTAEIDDINHNRRGHVRVGISHTRGRVLLSDILPGFKEAYPYVELAVVEGNTVELRERITRGEIDLLIDFAPIEAADIATVPILTERLYMCLPQKVMEERYPGMSYSQMADRMKEARIEDFIEYPFLMMTPDNQIRIMLDKIFAREGITPEIFLETDNIETLLALCVKGMGITFYPELFVKNLGLSFERAVEEQKVGFFPMEDPVTMGHLVVGYRQSAYISDAAKSFIAFVKDTYSAFALD